MPAASRRRVRASHTGLRLATAMSPAADAAPDGSPRPESVQRLATLATMHTQRMHKALTQMNLQLSIVLSDITGLTGPRTRSRRSTFGLSLID